ncbi:MAG TPA: DsbC family protein [Steroidobacteraceae bacterium]|nr:DsbC family protein [Steroidobacteraceae bacterium]
MPARPSLLLILTLLAPALHAQPAAQEDPRAQIASKIPGTHPDDVHPSAVTGIYEVSRGMEFAYVTADGKYAFSGDLIDLNANDNLTEERRRTARQKLIEAIPESDMIVFGPRDPKYTVTVFTDVDCAYCRELHLHIADYNRLGIRVRYLSYPRTGPNTESWTKAEEVWCSRNRNDALTAAKRGMALTTPPCAINPVAREYALGRTFDLKGTPAIVTADGEMFDGYVPPDTLAAHLREAPKR